MQISEHKPGNHHSIRQVTEDSVLIDDRRYESSLIVGARLLEPDWPVHSLEDLDAAALAPLLDREPELVILGFGTRQAFPAPEVQKEFLTRGIGVECMTLGAACRTFNVLMSENRRALAGLILPPRR